MKLYKFLFIITLLGCSTSSVDDNSFHAPDITPKPLKILHGQGMFDLSKDVRLMADFSDPEIFEFANEVLLSLEHLLGSRLLVNDIYTTKVPSRVIKLVLDKSIENNQAYLLEIRPTRVIMTARSVEGLHYAFITFSSRINSAITDASGTMSLPAVLIKDQPKNKIRGFNLLYHPTYNDLMMLLSKMEKSKLNLLIIPADSYDNKQYDSISVIAKSKKIRLMTIVKNNKIQIFGKSNVPSFTLIQMKSFLPSAINENHKYYLVAASDTSAFLSKPNIILYDTVKLILGHTADFENNIVAITNIEKLNETGKSKIVGGVFSVGNHQQLSDAAIRIAAKQFWEDDIYKLKD